MTTGTSDATPARVGLGLSGGGFRASLFHIGALARLADLDLLRHVQVISTVSGGSIIGALYYLHLRRLLQRKPDGEIRNQDYRAIVERIQAEFPLALRQNLRMRTFADFPNNARMYRRDYSRSDRMAELYEEVFYRPLVEDAEVFEGRVALPRLTVQPPDEAAGFHPFAAVAPGVTGNDRRRHKVPALVINAMTLNTGHNFQFTASWLGEPPNRPDQGDLDRNTRLRRAHFATDRLGAAKYYNFPLGVAVAASAGVPGIFPPLALTQLYPGFTPQLVDGGAHDNQGIEGLLDLGCTHLIVSDACGQMRDVTLPDTRMAAVLKRSNDGLMDRVREVQFAAVRAMQRHGGLSHVCFFHMKERLEQPELKWDDGSGAAPTAAVDAACGVTPYGVSEATQEALASLRTDLDAFSEVEAHALMADGYLIAAHRVDAALCAALAADPPPPICRPWPFFDVWSDLASTDPHGALLRHLRVGAATVGKSFAIVPWLTRAAASVLAASVVLALAAAVYVLGGAGVGTALGRGVALAVGVGIAAVVVRRWGWRLLQAITSRMPPRLAELAAAPIAAGLALAVRGHLRTLTVWRLRHSQLAALRGRPPRRGRRPAGRA
ncbi:MAG: patatin-like phospholipase family protein, partial [Candidatus Binatia bacterium]